MFDSCARRRWEHGEQQVCYGGFLTVHHRPGPCWDRNQTYDVSAEKIFSTTPGDQFYWDMHKNILLKKI